jgi:hypothetical protein
MVSSPLYLAVASSPFLKVNPPKSLTHFASSPFVHASSILSLVEDDLVRSTNREPTDDRICSFVLLFHLRPNYYRKHPVLADSLCFPLIFFTPMPPHVPYGLRGLPSRLWPSATDFCGWDAQEAQLRCPDEVGGNI